MPLDGEPVLIRQLETSLLRTGRGGQEGATDDRRARRGLDTSRWRHAHEIQALLDTLAIYRRYAVDLAAENTMLREQVAVLKAIASASLHVRPLS